MQVDLDARLIAVAGGQHHAVPLRVDLQDRADRGVELGVHQDQVLAVAERFERHVRPELHRAGDVDEHVDVLRPAQQHRIGGGHRLPRANGLVDLVLRLRDRRRQGRVGIAVRVDRAFDAAVGNRHQPHPNGGVLHLVGEATSHEAGTDQAHADRPIGGFACAQCPVENDHACCVTADVAPATSAGAACIVRRSSGSASASSGQTRSLSDMSVIGSGQVIASLGSS